MVKAFKSPVKLKGKTPKTIRKPDLLAVAPIVPPNYDQDVIMKDSDTIIPPEPEVVIERPSLSKSLFEKNSIFDEEPHALPSSNTSSEGSSPAKPPVRNSSLTFACLPAREPLATKKSMGAATKINAEGTITTANTEKKPTKMTIAQIKSSTQLLHEKISLLGQAMRTKPRKSIVATTPAEPSIAPKTPHVDQELELSKSKFQQIMQSARGRFAEKVEIPILPRNSPLITTTEEPRPSTRDEQKIPAGTAGRIVSNTKQAPTKDSRRPAKPTKEIGPKTKPQPVSIRVGTLSHSQRIPQLAVEKKRVEINKPARPNVTKTLLKPSSKRALEAETSEPKRRRTRDLEPPNGVRPTQKPPVRPSMHKVCVNWNEL